MTDRLRFTVVIPTYNAEAWVTDAIESVQAQNVDDLEIIVADDGSSDSTRSLVSNRFPEVRLLELNHGGVSRARNAGTAAASGAFIQYLDADDVLLPEKLVNQWHVLDETGADVAYGDYFTSTQGLDGSFAESQLVERRLEGEPELALFGSFWCPPAAYLFRRSIVDAIGGWNETLPVVQDARFALDCALHGGRFVRCAGAAAVYRIHQVQSLSRRDPMTFLGDCLRNAEQVEAWWSTHGGIAEPRRAALIDAYQVVARGTFRVNQQLFERAYNALQRLDPDFVPAGPRGLAFLTRLLGYPRAEECAYQYRRVKRVLSGARLSVSGGMHTQSPVAESMASRAGSLKQA